ASESVQGGGCAPVPMPHTDVPPAAAPADWRRRALEGRVVPTPYAGHPRCPRGCFSMGRRRGDHSNWGRSWALPAPGAWGRLMA
ncbi:MAG: hypothetical protein OWU84_09840, partial [Firmicutes bacterium]|nr:hypothetical protein [Bacillota bacterium]